MTRDKKCSTTNSVPRIIADAASSPHAKGQINLGFSGSFGLKSLIDVGQNGRVPAHPGALARYVFFFLE
jgi:hypothetical protein